MKRNITIAMAVLLASCLTSRAQQIDTIEVSDLFTTYIRYPIELVTAERSDMQNIMGEIVPESRNMVRLRAIGPFDRTSNLSVIDSRGYLHTCYIKYNQHPITTYYDKSGAQEYMRTVPSPSPDAPSAPRPDKGQRQGEQAAPYSGSGVYVADLRRKDTPLLQDIIDSPQSLYHLSSRKGGIVSTVENVYSYSDKIYIILRVDNKSGVSFESDGATFTLVTKSRSKKKPLNVTNVLPKSRYGTLTAAPGESAKIAYSFEKMSLAHDQMFEISVPEHNGARELLVKLSPNDINGAVRP